MKRFGTLLRAHRRHCRDPLRGGMLTQERLGELLGEALGHGGYSGAAVSDWERNKSKIDEDDRAVLVGLISVLAACGGLDSLQEANALLHAGNYRALDAEERRSLFEDAPSQAAGDDVEAPGMSAPVAPSGERRKQLLLLQKVRRFWVEGVLQTSLAGAAPLELLWERAPGMVQAPWEKIVHPELHSESGGKAIGEAFDNADRALLIVGEAGSGKTTSLLRLAETLCERAASTPGEAVPVVLNLSSWAADRLPLAAWVVDELVAKYQIPRRIGQPWLEDDALALLLDGFDELPALHRAACARAINAFRQEWGLTALAVSTRPAEYEACGLRLRLGGAIRLLPLTPAQRDAYLRAGGARLGALRQAMEEDEVVRQLGRSPLFLEVMSVVFGDAGRGEVSAPAISLAPGADHEVNIVEAREQLFRAYEQRMFQLHGPQALFSQEQTARQLSWLAAKMAQHDQTVFLLEELQPSWLSRRNRRLYLLLNHAFSGLGGGVILWLLLQWARAIIPQFPVVLAPVVASAVGLAPGAAEAGVMLSGSLALALLTGLVHLWQFERMPAASGVTSEWQLRRRGIFVGLLSGGLTTATVALFGEVALALSWGLALGCMYAMVSRYLVGSDYRHDIRAVEALGWSWLQAGKGLLLGLALAAALEVLETALFGYNGVVRSVLFFGFGGFLIGGLSGRRIEKKSRINQGILLSLRSALASSVLVALALGALTWVMRTPRAAVVTAVLAALVIFPFFGGATVLKHMLVRLFLWREGNMPWRYSRFLEHAAQFGLLRRVGGGFTFMHHLLQEYFARR